MLPVHAPHPNRKTPLASGVHRLICLRAACSLFVSSRAIVGVKTHCSWYVLVPFPWPRGLCASSCKESFPTSTVCSFLLGSEEFTRSLADSFRMDFSIARGVVVGVRTVPLIRLETLRASEQSIAHVYLGVSF